MFNVKSSRYTHAFSQQAKRTEGTCHIINETIHTLHTEGSFGTNAPSFNGSMELLVWKSIYGTVGIVLGLRNSRAGPSSSSPLDQIFEQLLVITRRLSSTAVMSYWLKCQQLLFKWYFHCNPVWLCILHFNHCCCGQHSRWNWQLHLWRCLLCKCLNVNWYFSLISVITRFQRLQHMSALLF